MKTYDLLPASKKRDLKIAFCLYGDEDTGKSETLTALSRALLGSSRYYYEQKGQGGSRDRRVSLKYRGMIVGICTEGDTSAAIDVNFDFLRQQHCEIGFMAARVTSGADLCAYAKTKTNKPTVFIPVRKRDFASLYSQQMAVAACVNAIVLALKCNGIKAIATDLKNIK